MKKEIIILLKIICICLILEVIVFNFNSYRTLFGKYPKIEFSKNDIELVQKESGIAKYQIKNINCPVASIRIKLKDVSKNFEYYFSYTDETSEIYHNMPTKTYVKNLKKSQYITCYLSGNVNKLLLTISDEVEKDEILEGIDINAKIPFQFNFARFLVLIGIMTFIYFIRHSTIMKEVYSNKNLKQELILLGIMAIFMVILFYINKNSVSDDSDNMYNKDMVDAILNKSVSLLEEPSEAFLNLKDPYDSLTRQKYTQRNVDYIWDSAYYNGKFYVYFGILPVLTIFLPYHVITGKYLKTEYLGYILSFIALLVLKEILSKILKKYFHKVPFKLVVYFFIMLCSGCLILYINGCMRFYEIAIISGLLCALLGFYFILLSTEKTKGKYRLYSTWLYFYGIICCV